MAGCGTYNRTITMDGTDQAIADIETGATELVMDFFVIIDPEASAAVTVTINGDAATWPAGMGRAFYGVDLLKFSFNGAVGDLVTITGQTAPVR